MKLAELCSLVNNKVLPRPKSMIKLQAHRAMPVDMGGSRPKFCEGLTHDDFSLYAIERPYLYASGDDCVELEGNLKSFSLGGGGRANDSPTAFVVSRLQ